MKTTKLRKAARGRDCQIRIQGGVCNGNAETVVLCHLPGGGMGGKRHDVHAALGCSACHDAVDGRSRVDIPQDTLMLWFHQAVIRTQIIWLSEGLIVV